MVNKQSKSNLSRFETSAGRRGPFYPVHGNYNALQSRQSDAISGTDGKLDQMIVPLDLLGPDWRAHTRTSAAVMSRARIPAGPSQTFFFNAPQGNLLCLAPPT